MSGANWTLDNMMIMWEREETSGGNQDSNGKNISLANLKHENCKHFPLPWTTIWPMTKTSCETSQLEHPLGADVSAQVIYFADWICLFGHFLISFQIQAPTRISIIHPAHRGYSVVTRWWWSKHLYDLKQFFTVLNNLTHVNEVFRPVSAAGKIIFKLK